MPRTSLKSLEGKVVQVETSEGVYREGRVTKVICHDVRLNGRSFMHPKEIELNGDSMDTIEFFRMKSIEVTSP